MNATVEAFPIERFLSEESKAQLSEPERAAISDYLKAFGLFDDVVCRCKCGRSLTGILGAFTWGLAHGEGGCGECGWPARGIHRVDIGRENPAYFQVPLPYHPDFVESSD